MSRLIDDYLKEGYEYELERAKITHDAVLKAEVRSNFVVPFSALSHLKSELKDKINGVQSVQIVFHYRDMAQRENEIVDAYMPYLRSLARRASSVMSGALTDEYSFSDSRLTIYVVGETAQEQFNEHLSGKFSKILADNFGIIADVVFENNTDRYSNAAEEIEKDDACEESDNVPSDMPAERGGGKKGGSVIAGGAVRG